MENSEIEAAVPPNNDSTSVESSPVSEVEHFEEPRIISPYHCVLRLLQLIQTVQIHHKYKFLMADTEQICGLQDKLHSLLKLLEDLPRKIVSSIIQPLSKKLHACSMNWSNIIDRHVVDQKRGVYANECDEAISVFNKGIAIVIQELDDIIQQLTSVCSDCSSSLKMIVREDVVQSSSLTGVNVDTRPYKVGEMTSVGIENSLRKVKEALFSSVKDLQVIAIVGMGGTDKTTLAQEIYMDPVTTKHFDRRYWVTVSQEYDVTRILQDIVGDKNINQKSVLGEKMQQEIFNRRFLIVLDDLWSVDAWEDLAKHIPRNTQRSRIIVTTRYSKVADSSSPILSHPVGLLDEEASWDLLSKKVFVGEGCPVELEEIGRDIARNCKGLPISIATIGGLLSKSDRTLEYWTYVAQNVTSLVGIADDERCMKILFLCYESMPTYLQLCFLTLASYREDEVISVSKLIRLWIVNAFVKPKASQRIEEVSLDYLKDLVGRNMIFVRKFDKIGGMKDLGIHDLLLEMCRKKASNENVDLDGSLGMVTARCVGCSTTHFTGCYGIFPTKCSGRIFHQLRYISPLTPSQSACFCFECNKFELREHFNSGMSHPNFSSNSLPLCEVKVPHFHGVADDIICFESLEDSNYHIPINTLWNVQEHSGDTRGTYQMMMAEPQLCFSAVLPMPMSRNDEGVVFEHLVEIGNLYYRNMIPLGSRSYPSHLLRRLCICDSYINEDDIRAIKDLPNLKQLVLTDCDPIRHKVCGDPPGFRSLKHMGISGGNVWSLIVEQIADFPQLQMLWLRDVDIEGWNNRLSDVSTLHSMRLDGFEPSDIDMMKEIMQKSFYVNVDGNSVWFNKHDTKPEEEEGEFKLFEMMMMSMDRWKAGNYNDVIEYQTCLDTAQQQEHLFIFGSRPDDDVKGYAPIIGSMFPNLKVINYFDEWDGCPLFPSIKKLPIHNTWIDEERTKCIMELQNLEMLEFFQCTFENDEWCSLSEGEFSKLKQLAFLNCHSLKSLKLVDDQFPQLLTLKIYCLETLDMSDDDICGLPSSLRSIKLRFCGNSVVESAKEILKEKKANGDDLFFVQVDERLLSVSESEDD